MQMMTKALVLALLTVTLAGCGVVNPELYADPLPAHGDPEPTGSRPQKSQSVAGERSELELPCPPRQRRFIVLGFMAPYPTMLSAAHVADGKERVQVAWRDGNHVVAMVRGVPGHSPARYDLYRLQEGWFVDEIEFCQLKGQPT